MPYVYQTMKQVAYIVSYMLIVIGCEFKTAQNLVTEAAKLSELGKYEDAIELLNKAIEKDPRYIGAYINRGADKSALENYEAAISDYKIVLNFDSSNTLALYNIGNNYKRIYKFHTAIEYYNLAFETKGGQEFYYDINSINFMNLNTLNEFDVPGHEIHFERAIAYYSIDSLHQAFDDFNVAISKNYMTAESYWWIGYIYASSEQEDLACQSFKIARQLGKENIDEEIRKYCNEYK